MVHIGAGGFVAGVLATPVVGAVLAVEGDDDLGVRQQFAVDFAQDGQETEDPSEVAGAVRVDPYGVYLAVAGVSGAVCLIRDYGSRRVSAGLCR